ncbi:MAG: DUF1622 domain-containing protein [Syntrophales bacterium]|nr:DUF1622 domain-containing protein [Syntrophales bacterium]MDD5234263.1 DUF1622 domain-containing protein [Syntrophales bacterium]MDD5531803.1 DUF1622 domain-containing protein [Syntrophales bacterium]
MDRFREYMEIIGIAVDGFGVFVIVAGAFWSAVLFILAERGSAARSFSSFRQNLGRAILLGLEFLIAGDIIRTVVVAPSLENVTILGLIVLIRTFLSFTLEVEIAGMLPWRKEK